MQDHTGNKSALQPAIIKPEAVKYSAMTIDVEDGLNILMHDLFDQQMPPTERVIVNVRVLLELFRQKNVRATFFILGEIASSYPFLVREIADDGHELGVHGYHHDQLFRLSPARAREDIYKAKSLIEDISGHQVEGFRAPAFSITEATGWALNVIAGLGFRYDSSIVPAVTGRYGWQSAVRDIHRIILHDGSSLIEVPLSVVSILGKRIPACGGGYLRYLPYSFSLGAFLKIVQQRPVIVYLHPYEIDKERYPSFFYEAKATLDWRKRIPLEFYRLNKGTVKGKLERLLTRFPFKPLREIIDDLEIQSELQVKRLSK